MVGDFPVLSAGPTQHTALANWTFSITGGRDQKSWTWKEFRALPAETITVDIHCVTSWSKLDTTWRGVSLDVLLAALDYDARYVLAYCDGGYTTNMPVADLTGGRAWVAFGYGGNPLGPEHGGPARLLVPHLYFWKSAKWVRGLRLRDTDEPGFWENYGYHMYSRPMARTAVRGRLTWHAVAAGSVISETPTARTVVIDVPGWPGHRAGQHVDIRLTAEDGYQAGVASSIRQPGTRQPRLTGPGRSAGQAGLGRGLAGPQLPGQELPSRLPHQAASCCPWQKKILEDISYTEGCVDPSTQNLPRSQNPPRKVRRSRYRRVRRSQWGH